MILSALKKLFKNIALFVLAVIFVKASVALDVSDIFAQEREGDDEGTQIEDTVERGPEGQIPSFTNFINRIMFDDGETSPRGMREILGSEGAVLKAKKVFCDGQFKFVEDCSGLGGGGGLASALEVQSDKEVLTDTCGGTSSGDGLCDQPYYKDVVFTQPFAAPPHIVVSAAHVLEDPACAGGATDAVYALAQNVTETGFRLVASGSPAANSGCSNNGLWGQATANWMAVNIESAPPAFDHAYGVADHGDIITPIAGFDKDDCSFMASAGLTMENDGAYKRSRHYSGWWEHHATGWQVFTGLRSVRGGSTGAPTPVTNGKLSYMMICSR